VGWVARGAPPRSPRDRDSLTQQIVEAFPDDSAPRLLLRDRDSIYGAEFRRRVKGMRIAEILTAPRSPWQNPFAERMIGTIRRDFLDHVIVLNEGHLRRRLHGYLRYYHGSRTHLALEKDAPEPRAVDARYARLRGTRRMMVIGVLDHSMIRRRSGISWVQPPNRVFGNDTLTRKR